MSSGRQAFELEQERTLPGVMMAEEGKIFSILYQLAETEDAGTIAGVTQRCSFVSFLTNFFSVLSGGVVAGRTATASPPPHEAIHK